MDVLQGTVMATISPPRPSNQQLPSEVASSEVFCKPHHAQSTGGQKTSGKASRTTLHEFGFGFFPDSNRFAVAFGIGLTIDDDLFASEHMVIEPALNDFKNVLMLKRQ